MNCSVCGGPQSADDQPIEHTPECRIGRRRAYLAERDDPLGVGGIAASSLGRVGGKPPRNQKTRDKVSIPIPGRGEM